MIATDRLILRPWREADVAPFLAMGRDRAVMRHLGPLLDDADARATYGRMVAMQADHGHCFWAVERRVDATFLGFCGLKPGDPPIAGQIEIGWRLAHTAWGQGYATEAARASLDWAWTHLDTAAVTAITVPANRQSWRVMERIGMVRRPDEDFDHPALAPGDPLRPHILYRIARPDGR